MFRQPRRRVIFGPVWTTGAIATIWIELESWRTRIIVGDHSQRNDSDDWSKQIQMSIQAFNISPKINAF